MNTQSRNGAYLNKQLGVLVKAVVSLQDKLATHCNECLLHLQEHGDVIFIERTINGLPVSQRTATIKLWFLKASGEQIVAKKNKETGQYVLSMKKGWDKAKIDMVWAEANPFWTLGAEKVPADVSLESLIGIVKGLFGKIDKSVKEGTFVGDAGMAKAVLAPVISLAEHRAAAAAAGTLADRLSNTREKSDAPRVVDAQAVAA